MVLSKLQILEALRAANFDPPVSASVSQLRNMYDEHIREQVNKIIHTDGANGIADDAEQWGDATDDGSQPNDQESSPTENAASPSSQENLLETPNASVAFASPIAPVALAEPNAVTAALVTDAEIDAELNKLEKLQRIATLRADFAAMNINIGNLLPMCNVQLFHLRVMTHVELQNG